MKKIASAVLFVTLVASANASFLSHLSDNKGKYLTGTTVATATGLALYYEIKHNNSEVLKEAKRLIKDNPKAAAGILAAVTAVSGLTADVALRGDESLVLIASNGIKEGSEAAYDAIAAIPSKVANGVKALIPFGSANTVADEDPTDK